MYIRTLAPTFCNIYFSAGWQGGGIAVQRQAGYGCSVPSWEEVGWRQDSKIEIEHGESQFTDDVALYTGS